MFFDSLVTISNSKKKRKTLTGTLKGEVFAVSMELGFSDVLVPEILRLRGDLSAGTSEKEGNKHH